MMWEVLRYVFALLLILGTIGGYGAFFSRTFGVRAEFLPSVGISVIALAVYLFGLVGFLRPGIYAVTLIGILMLLRHCVLSVRKKASFGFLRCGGILFFAAAVILLSVRLWNVTYTHYDNFSHWGTVVREMLRSDTFSHPDMVIVFRNYPPLTACFLYWFCRFAGYSEGITLIAQGIMTVSALCALFVGLQSKRRIAAACAAALSLLAVVRYDNGSLPIDNLLVDALLGVMTGAAVIAFCVSLRDIKALLATLLPLLSAIALIKDNGTVLLIIVLVTGGILFRINAPDADGITVRRTLFWLAVIPLSFAGLWRLYLVVTYGLAEMHPDSALAGRIAPYLTPWALLLCAVGILAALAGLYWLISRHVRVFFVLAGLCLAGGVIVWILMATRRPEGFFQEFFSVLCLEITDWKSQTVRVFAGMNVLLCAAYFVPLLRTSRPAVARIWAGGNLMICAYFTFLMFFYTVLMAEDEARCLAAYDRYIGTAVLLFCMLVFFVLLRVAVPYQKADWIPAAAAFFTVCGLCCGAVLQLLHGPDFTNSERHKVMEACRQAVGGLDRNASVMMYVGDCGRRDLYYYIMLYEFSTPHCMVLDYRCPEEGIREDTARAAEFDYFVIAADVGELRSVMSQIGMEFYYQEGCTLYRREFRNGSTVFLPAGI